MGLLSGKVAVVTGAGRGIGRAIACLFAEEGANVVVNDLDIEPADSAAQACAAIRAGSARASVGSVADSRYTDHLMESAVEAFGKIDILVNNAGITRDRVIHKMTDEDWEFVLSVNLTGTFNCIRSTVPYMRDVAKAEIEANGRVRGHRKIVNFYSTAAIRGNPGQANYTAAKMGNVGLTRTVAQEWGRFCINVNAVAPGLTETRLSHAKARGDAGPFGIPEDQRAAMIQRIPFGRIAEPLDIARVVLFFASPLSDFVTGQCVNVSGGMQIP
ncbi:MAG: 3-oxoacyl-ACP reductase FabG [Deltaproteobacteria bacterium]|nr:3-oxoacyl-ACP reductase FabG [Deltaproteobacteria bacterium]